jgi:hypothetical protein
VAGFPLARVGVDVVYVDVERDSLVARPRCHGLGRNPRLLVQLPKSRPCQRLVLGLGVSAGSEDFAARQVQHVQDAAERIDDDRAAGDVSGEGGAAGDIGGTVEGAQEAAELRAFVRVASEVGLDGGADVVG